MTCTYVNFVLRVDKFLSIKIADFGLARDIYSTEYYRVDTHTTLPVKWMSLESLLDGLFDEKTDVVCMYDEMQYVIVKSRYEGDIVFITQSRG